MTSGTVRKVLSVVFVLLVAAVVVRYAVNNADRFAALLHVSARTVAVAAVLVLLGICGRGGINALFYKEIGAKLSLSAGCFIALINTFGNLLPLSGGFVAKGLYLKSRHRTELKRYFPATAALTVCYVSTNGIIGLVVMAYRALAHGYGMPGAITVGFALMAASIGLVWLPLERVAPGRTSQLASKLDRGWLVLARNPSLLLGLLLLQILGVLLVAGRFLIFFRLLSMEVGFAECLAFSSATVLTRLVSIVPGGIGIREGIVAGMGVAMGLDFAASAVAVSIDRAFALAVSVPVLLGLYLLERKRKETPLPGDAS